MGTIADRLDELDLTLPPPVRLPPDVVLPFDFVRILGNRAIVSGHGPQRPDGSLAEPLGRVGGADGVTVEQAYEAARLTALSILGSLDRALGDLDRIEAWGRVFAMVWSTPDFHHQPAVINGFSDLILDVFGPDIGAHARSAIGVASLPFRIPVEIEAEVILHS